MTSNESNIDEGIDVNEGDETFSERLLGLLEMIPASVQAPLGIFAKCVWSAYQTACDASWVFITTFAILFGPAMLEAERQYQDSLDKTNKNQQTIDDPIKKLPAEAETQ